MKNRSLVLAALVGLAGASALSCASQSAATTAPAETHDATAAASNTAAPADSSTAAPATAQQTPPPPGEGPVVGPPQVAWKDMTKAQRGKYMGAVVMPKMKQVFQAYDAQKFAEFGCKTCHGQKAREVGFQMPNAEIFVLPATPEEFGTLMKEKPDWMQFMSQKVKPEMAALLGVKEYDWQHPEPGTLGCTHCHTSTQGTQKK